MPSRSPVAPHHPTVQSVRGREGSPLTYGRKTCVPWEILLYRLHRYSTILLYYTIILLLPPPPLLLSFRDIGSVFIPTCFIKFALYRPCIAKQYEKTSVRLLYMIYNMYYVYVNDHIYIRNVYIGKCRYSQWVGGSTAI